MRVPLADVMKSERVTPVDLALRLAWRYRARVARAPAASIRTGRFVDDDALSFGSRKEKAAAFGLPPFHLPMCIKMAQDSFGENDDLSGVADWKSYHVRTTPRQLGQLGSTGQRRPSIFPPRVRPFERSIHAAENAPPVN